MTKQVFPTIVFSWKHSNLSYISIFVFYVDNTVSSPKIHMRKTRFNFKNQLHRGSQA